MTSRRFWSALVLGLALAAAPVAFQMFTRAPGGATMLEAFAPYMDAEVLAGFAAQLDATDLAVREADAVAPAVLEAELGTTEASPAITRLVDAWPTIRDEMVGMVDDITANIDNYEAVDALPSFRLFPWFFVLPGLATAAVAVVGLLARHRNYPTARPRWVLVAIGVGLVAAPFAFQMFTRAPLGGAMIDDFEPLMTTANITTVQGHFLTMASGEAALRNDVLAPLAAAGLTDAELAELLPATTAFVAVWPTMSAGMAPMLGAMSDNVANFAGIAALPPFPLFPWFFVAPGVLLGAIALAPTRRRATSDDAHDDDRDAAPRPVDALTN